MGGTGYELRTFEPLPYDSSETDENLLDLYVYKRGLTSVGVKIRKPHLTKDGNYKFKKFQVKEMMQEREGLQMWRKQVVQMEEEFVLKEHKLNKLNDLLQNYSKQLQNPTEQLKLWVQQPIDRVVRIAKSKYKSAGEQQAQLEVYDLYRQQPRWKFSSLAYEDNNFEPLLKLKIQKKIVSNTSYPQLLERLFSKPHVTL